MKRLLQAIKLQPKKATFIKKLTLFHYLFYTFSSIKSIGLHMVKKLNYA